MPKVSLSKTILLTAGAAFTALLFAPKSGKEFRQDLKVEAEKLGDKTKKQAQYLKEDFKESYAEAQQEVEQERELMDQKQAELARTIEDIESDIETEEQTPSLAATPESVTKDIDLGNVRGTVQEPTKDQVVPSGELDEALHDNYLSNDEKFDVDEEEVNPNK